MASLPVNFSVTRTRTCPVRNPEPSLPLPSNYEKLDIRSISGPFAVSGVSKSPVPAPVALTVTASAMLNPPTVRTGLPIPPLTLPIIPTIVASADVGVPTSRAVVPSQSVSVPSSRTQVSAPDTPAPTTITPNAGTRTTPPFPLNHARILHTNFIAESILTVTDSDAGTPTNSLTLNTFESWDFDASDGASILYELSINRNMDTFCIGGHNLGSIGATVTMSYDTDTAPGGFTNIVAPFTVTSDNAIMIHVSSFVSVRRFQISITGGSGGRIGYVSGGLALQMQRPFFNGHTPITDATVSQFYTSYTETFALIAKERRRVGQQTTAEWKNLDDTWYRANFEPIKSILESQPYFFAWNLLQFPNDVGFVQTENDISAPYNGVNELRNLSIPMRGTL